jgi:hypothetical protein
MLELMASDALRTAQRTVKRGALLGLITLVTAFVAGYVWLPPLAGPDAIDVRLALAVRCAVLPTITLLAGVGAIGNARFFSDAIDPTAGKDSQRMQIHARYVDNTTQQLLLYLTVSFGLAVELPFSLVRLLPVLAATFTIGRVAFWIGYLKGPLHRAPGFAMTFYPSAIALAWLAWRVVRAAIG